MDELLRLAQTGSLGSAPAVDALLRREDAADIMLRALGIDDAAMRSAGFAMARDMRPADPRLAGVLIEKLGSLSFEPWRDAPKRIADCGRCEMILLLIAEARLATSEMLATLRALMRKLARHDAIFKKQGDYEEREGGRDVSAANLRVLCALRSHPSAVILIL